MEIKRKVVEYYKKMLTDNLTVGTGGNISIYNQESKKIYLTPTGIHPMDLKEEDISVLNLEGELLEGKKPSSEIDMHSIFYKKKEEINSVIHAHTKYATAISCTRQDMPAIDYLIALSGDIKINCAKYASYGTMELAENAFEAMGSGKAVLLANHGITVVGKSIEEAYNLIQQIEYVAELFINASKIGTPVVLSDEEMTEMIRRFKNYGQKER